MARGTRTVYPGKWNKGLSSTFQPPEEGWSVQRPKCCNKHGDKDKDNSQNNVNNKATVAYKRLSLVTWNHIIAWKKKKMTKYPNKGVPVIKPNHIKSLTNKLF